MALRYFGTHWTYRDLLFRVRKVATRLQEMGIGPGDRVILVLPNCPEFVVTWFALHWLGAEVVPANPLLTSTELVHLADKTQAKAIFGLDVKLRPVTQCVRNRPQLQMVVVSLAPHLPVHLSWAYRLKVGLDRGARPPAKARAIPFHKLYRPKGSLLERPLTADPSLPAVLQPTGGTTGTPKLAVLSHQNLHANVTQVHLFSGLEPGVEVVLSVLPFFHIFGSTVALLSPLAGGATILPQARFCASRVLGVLNKWRPTVVPMVPYMFRSLCDELENRRERLQGIKFCMSGASPLARRTAERFFKLSGTPILEGYGLSEASPVTHCNPPGLASRQGSIGIPIPHTEAKIVDVHTGSDSVAPGAVGELVVRGPQVMQGYLDEPDETNQVLCDGWLHTGDLAACDADGYFRIVDRKKDMILSGGLNIYPTEVEKVLRTHPHVKACAVVGEPHPSFGECAVAYVVVASGKQLNAEALERHCRSSLASYKVPRIYRACDSLPETFLGKVRRVELRSRAAA